MLHLASRTPPEWSRWALSHIEDMLLDHAHCEKKAASTAVGLIFRYPDHGSLVVPLSQLAREELEHFELVVGQLQRLGIQFRRLRPSPYAHRLLEVVRPGEPHRVLDTLLCCALIEARSCERMQLLADALGATDHDPELTELYQGLLVSEARHHATYVDLARGLGIVDESTLRRRLAEVAEHEAAVIAGAPRIPRLHN